jgi:hypothetical protein
MREESHAPVEFHSKAWRPRWLESPGSRHGTPFMEFNHEPESEVMSTGVSRRDNPI